MSINKYPAGNNNNLNSFISFYEILPISSIIYHYYLKTILFANKQAEIMFGANNEEFVGKHISDLFPEYFKKKYHKYFNIKKFKNYPVVIDEPDNIFCVRNDGTEFPVRIILTVINIDDEIFVILLIMDITKYVQIIKDGKLFRALLDNSNDAIEILDYKTGRFLDGNKAAWEMLGYSRDEFLKLSVFDTDPLLNLKNFQNYCKIIKHKNFVFKAKHKRKDGSMFPVEINLNYLKLKKEYMIAGVRDITNLTGVEHKIEYQVLYDDLTGLPNRSMLYLNLDEIISLNNKKNNPFALLQIDINRFNEINSTIGYDYADVLLKKIAKKINNIVANNGTVFRTGGNEFFLLLNSFVRAQAINLMEKILLELEDPFIIEDIPINVEVSTGITLYPEHGTNKEALIKNSSIALSVSKNNGPYVIFSSEQDKYNPYNLSLIGELRQAIKNNELLLHYQPQINIKTGEVIGLEALIRWDNPNQGLIMPDQFIPLIEQTALITPLTLWVFEVAIQEISILHQKGFFIPIAVNLTVKNFIDKKFPNKLECIFKRFGHIVKSLEVEITESAIISDPGYAINVLNKFRKFGIKFIIDDFGTGYSSLSHLQRLPIDKLKIDKSFVKNMLDNEKDSLIVDSTISLSHNLKLPVVAEGVETLEILNKLSEFNCDIAQGYVIAYPMPASQLYVWLQDRKNKYGKF